MARTFYFTHARCGVNGRNGTVMARQWHANGTTLARRSWGSLRQLPSGRIQARYTAPDGLIYKAPHTFKDELAASAWLDSERKAIDLETWTPPTSRNTEKYTVVSWVDHWLESMRSTLRESSLASYENIIKNRISNDEPLGKIKLEKLTPVHVSDWWTRITKNNPSTTNRNTKAYRLLKSALEAAVEQELIQSNPVKVKAAQRKPKPKVKQLPEDAELNAILEHTPQHYKAAVALCLFHGLRVGECLGLQIKNVIKTSQGLIVRIDSNIQRVPKKDGSGIMMKRHAPKTPAGYRDVPILKEFETLILNQIEGKLDPEELVTTTLTGNMVMDTSFRSMFERAKAKAGAPAEITPHYGRNWLITRLAESGATPKEIGRILGQDDITTIINVYMKVREQRPMELMSRISIHQSAH